jgi:hypothetical protein
MSESAEYGHGIIRCPDIVYVMKFGLSRVVYDALNSSLTM